MSKGVGVASGCLVLVDGWNHFLSAQTCFGPGIAREFPVDRLAWHLAAATGEGGLVDVVVLMAIPDRNEPGEEPEYWAWRKRLNKLRNFGVRHERARFSYQATLCKKCASALEREITCVRCGHVNPVSGRRKEKGADIKLAVLALDGAWEQGYSTLVICSKDSDFGPLVRQLKEVHKGQGRYYNLYSAFPVCGDTGHTHYKVPGAKELRLDAGTYAKLAAESNKHVKPADPPATSESPGM